MLFRYRSLIRGNNTSNDGNVLANKSEEEQVFVFTTIIAFLI